MGFMHATIIECMYIQMIFANYNAKVAIIKQDMYPDLYLAEPGDKDFFKKSVRRSGPLGLVDFFECDFYIVKTEDDEECNLWRKKITQAGHSSEEKWLKLPHMLSYAGKTQAQCAINYSEIPFDEYDIIISFDFSIPERVVKQFPSQLWCYYISEPPLDSYVESWEKPLCGYDVFFSQRFRTEQQLSKSKSRHTKHHIIDMPYVAASSMTYSSLFEFEKKKKQTNQKPTAILPKYLNKELTSEQKNRLSDKLEIKTAHGNIEKYLSTLYNADYYLKLGPKKKFGNETIEAVAAGCLFLSSKQGFANRVFDVETTVIKGLDIDSQITEVLGLIASYEANKELRQAVKRQQTQILNRICYVSPIMQLLEKLDSKTISRSL